MLKLFSDLSSDAVTAARRVPHLHLLKARFAEVRDEIITLADWEIGFRPGGGYRGGARGNARAPLRRAAPRSRARSYDAARSYA